MRTTLNLDQKALKGAIKAAGPGKTKTAVINEALREFARLKRIAQIDGLWGLGKPWRGNLDRLRKRT